MGRRNRGNRPVSASPIPQKNSTLPARAIPRDLREARTEVLACLMARGEGFAAAKEMPLAYVSWTPSQIADECGVPVRRVLELLSTLRSAPWTDTRGGELVVTEAGREKICVELAAAMAAEKDAPPAAKPSSGVDLRVTRRWNAKGVVTDRVDNGNEVLCRVQSSEFLMPGMVLKDARRGANGVWSYYGRLPRRKGRW